MSDNAGNLCVEVQCGVVSQCQKIGFDSFQLFLLELQLTLEKAPDLNLCRRAFDKPEGQKHIGSMDRFCKNPHLKSMEKDVLYHLAIGTDTHNLKRMFEDVKVSA